MSISFLQLLLINVVHGGITFFNVVPEVEDDICFKLRSNELEATIGPINYGKQEWFPLDTEKYQSLLVSVVSCDNTKSIETDIPVELDNPILSAFVGLGLDTDGATKVHVIENDIGWADFKHQARGYSTCGYKTGVFFGGYLTLDATFSIDISCDEYQLFQNESLSVTCDNDDFLVTAKANVELDKICAGASKRFLAIGDAANVNAFPLEIILLQAAQIDVCDRCSNYVSSGGESSSQKNNKSVKKSTIHLIMTLTILVVVFGFIIFLGALFCYLRYRRHRQLKHLEETRGKSVSTLDDQDTQIEIETY